MTDDLLKTTQSHLPRADDSEEGSQTFNPVLPALLSELVVHPFTSVQGMDKVTTGHSVCVCVGGEGCVWVCMCVCVHVCVCVCVYV